ncbi:MAG: protease complex subunit PrcB family protein [Psychroflexus sp.]|nr:protease complex subunit PrcB family protein [Psychroflexus sp.]
MELVLNTNVPAQIGNTGLIIDIQNLKIDLSRTENILEADLDGRPLEFMGVYTDYTAITLPQKWFNNVDNSTLRIAGYNLLIGTGGVSGTVALEAIDGTPNNGIDYMNVKIGNWQLGFNHFDLTFRQNSITESHIGGRLIIPKLKDAQGNQAEILIKGHLNEEGDFNLTASEPEGIPLNLFNFVTFNFLSVELGKEDDNFYIGTQCEIWFENAIMQKILGEQKIVIPKLRVYDNGSIEIVGGNAFIPTNISLNLGPVEVAVTGIHFGSHQQEHNGVMRKYNYWGFDGAISLDPLGIDARGEGIKYYYTTDNDEKLQEALESGAITQQQIDNGDVSADDYGDTFLRIQTIEVDMIIPGTASPESALAIIHGMVSIPEPGDSPEYIGAVSVKLPKARIGGGAAMRLQPKHPAFLLEVGIDMAIPIPLAATGLGFYGFGGLLGYRYVAEKGAIGMTSDNTWYEYFKHPQRGVNIQKFSGPPRSLEFGNPFSIGAGTVIGTMGDDGNLFSTRLMAILSLPSVFILDGRANILSERLGMMDSKEPPFFAGVAIGDNSFEFWFGADYNLPESNGNIIDLYAEVQAYFSTNNSKAWYIHFGTKQNPIQAELLFHIFRMQSYLMISAQGIEAGARADFYLEKKFFGIRVKISAYLELGGFISFERPQIGGYIAAGGMIGVNVWRVLFVDIGLDVILSVEAVKPFLIYAELRVRIKIRVLRFIKIKFKVTLKLKWEFNSQVDRTPVIPLEYERVEQAVKGIHMLTQEAFDLDYFDSVPNHAQITQTLPLDTYVDIKVAKGLVPGAVTNKIGGFTSSPENHVDLIPPKKNVRGGWELRQVKHKYSIEAINIKAWNGSSWQDYHPFEAVVHADDRTSEISNLKVGYWQKLDKQYDTIRLLATNPFTFTESGEPGWVIPEQFGITASDLFCQSEVKQHDCSNVLNKPLGTIYYPPTQYVAHFIDGAYYTLDGEYYQTVDANTGEVTIEEDHFRVTNAPNNFGFAKSLEFDNYNALVIILPEPSVETKLKLTSNAQSVKIAYYKSVRDDNAPTTSYVQFDQQIISQSQLGNVITSPNSNELITKIIISPQTENTVQILSVQEQMAQLQQLADIQNNGVLEGELLAEYEELENYLKKLKSEGCSESLGVNDDCKELSIDEITNSEYGSWGEKHEKLLNTEEELKYYWERHHANQSPMPNTPEINFNTHSVIVIGFGQFSSGGSKRTLRKITEKKGILNVCIETDTPNIGTSAITAPYLFVRIPKTVSSIVKLDCVDCCEKVARLCEFHIYLENTLNNCISYKVKDLFWDNWSCFENFIKLIYEFDKANPQYYLVESIQAALQNLIDYPNTAKPPVLEGALQLAQTILNLISEMGNCDCTPEEKTDCTTSLQEVCWMTLENWEYNQTIPGTDAIVAEQQAMVNGVQKTVQPIWRPNTKYYVHFQLKDEVDNGANQGTYHYYYGFKTAGPVGHFHKQVPYVPTGEHADQYPITSLRSYIDYNRSYPNADGNLLQAKPLFYGQEQCTLDIYFIKPLAYHMLNTWNEYNGLPELLGEMHLAIKDPVTDVIIPYPLPVDFEEETVPGTITSWENDDDPRIPIQIQMLNNFIEHINEFSDTISCELTLGEAVKPLSYNYSVQLTNLKPRKLYTALVYNAFDVNGNGNLEDVESEKVHEYVFQTSRYKNFRTQVESYWLKETDAEGTIVQQRQAVFDYPLDINQIQIDTLFSLINGIPNANAQALENQFYHSFDRALEGILGITPPNPPENTEFNKIINESTGEVIALWIRNPEPFNNPKIPLKLINAEVDIVNSNNQKIDETDASITVIDNQGNALSEYYYLHSKDYSQVLIMNNSKKISDNMLNFRFHYIIWNGSKYVVFDESSIPVNERIHTVEVNQIIINQ